MKFSTDILRSIFILLVFFTFLGGREVISTFSMNNANSSDKNKKTSPQPEDNEDEGSEETEYEVDLFHQNLWKFHFFNENSTVSNIAISFVFYNGDYLSSFFSPPDFLS